jgi:hypothetical protein
MCPEHSHIPDIFKMLRTNVSTCYTVRGKADVNNAEDVLNNFILRGLVTLNHANYMP